MIADALLIFIGIAGAAVAYAARTRDEPPNPHAINDEYDDLTQEIR